MKVANFTATGLVADPAGIEGVRHARFRDSLFQYILALPHTEHLEIDVFAATSQKISYTVRVSNSVRAIDTLTEELSAVFTSLDGPFIGHVEVVEGERTASRVLEVAPQRVGGNTSRWFEVLSPHVPTTPEILWTALLRNPGYRLVVRVAFRDRDLQQLLLHLEKKDGVQRTPRGFAAELADRGLPLRIRLQLFCPDENEVPTGLRAALADATGGWIATSRPGQPVESEDREEGLLIDWSSAGRLIGVPLAVGMTHVGLPVIGGRPRPAGVEVLVRGKPSETLPLGMAIDASGIEHEVGISKMDLDRHLYCPGQTGSGKSTFMRKLACEIAARGEGLLFIDPHGDTVERLIAELPRERLDDVVYIDASEVDTPATMNPFAVEDPLLRDTAMENVTAMFYDLFDPEQQGIVGPRWETWFRMGMTTLLEAFGPRATLLDVPVLFVDPALLRHCLTKIQNRVVLDFWTKEMAQIENFHKSEVLGWFSSKFTAFRMNSVLRATLGSGTDVIEPYQTMQDSRIVLVSLPKGRIGAPVTQVLGYLYLTRFWTAALLRTAIDPPFTVLVDEAQSFSRGSLPAMLSEGRKFRLRTVLANQYLGQLPDNLTNAIVGNVGNLVVLRVGPADASAVLDRMGHEVSAFELSMLPNFSALASILCDGRPSAPFTLRVDHHFRKPDYEAVGDRAGEALAATRNSLAERVREAKGGLESPLDLYYQSVQTDSDFPDDSGQAPSFLERWKRQRVLEDQDSNSSGHSEGVGE